MKNNNCENNLTNEIVLESPHTQLIDLLSAKCDKAAEKLLIGCSKLGCDKCSLYVKGDGCNLVLPLYYFLQGFKAGNTDESTHLQLIEQVKNLFPAF